MRTSMNKNNLARMSPTEWRTFYAVAVNTPAEGATVDYVQRQLELREPRRSHQTIASLLTRLFDKGWVHFETAPTNKIRYYRPTYSFEEALALTLRSILTEYQLSDPESRQLLVEILHREP